MVFQALLEVVVSAQSCWGEHLEDARVVTL